MNNSFIYNIVNFMKQEVQHNYIFLLLQKYHNIVICRVILLDYSEAENVIKKILSFSYDYYTYIFSSYRSTDRK